MTPNRFLPSDDVHVVYNNKVYVVSMFKQENGREGEKRMVQGG